MNTLLARLLKLSVCLRRVPPLPCEKNQHDLTEDLVACNLDQANLSSSSNIAGIYRRESMEFIMEQKRLTM